jgi:hypothetical protein
MINDRTPYLNLPLPNQANELQEDLPRLRESLNVLDAKARAADQQIPAAATQAEVNTGSDSAKFVTPNTLKNTTFNASRISGGVLDISLIPDAALEDNLANATGTLAIANGGTGATTAAEARDALGLGNTTGALPIANGGTGATTVADAATALGLGTASDVTHKSVKTAGTTTATGFILADGSDLAALFGKLNTASNATSGSGAFVKNVALSVSGKDVILTKTLGAATYCSYCNYCSYCAGNCDCN